MAIGKRRKNDQPSLWIETNAIAKGAGHPFYDRLNRMLAEKGFDEYAEKACARFYADQVGRPGIPPGVYFRMLIVGYLEGIDSERGISWRCQDSLALRGFLGYSLTEDTPDHSTLSRIRSRIDEETHQKVFRWVLDVIAQYGLVRGTSVGVDATTLEANAAMKSIVRRDTGEEYREFLARLAKASGIEAPTPEDLQRFDKKREGKKSSNDDWTHPSDPDARITKMKDGRTHMGHKSEHAVDLDTGAVLAVQVRGADEGDTATILDSVLEAQENLEAVRRGEDPAAAPADSTVAEVVTDKGYHSSSLIADLTDAGIRTYIAQPRGPRRRWEGKPREERSVRGNRRRIRSERGKRLLRRRGEIVERTFALIYGTGRLRRAHLRGRPNILKRLLIHVCGYNLALLMRRLFGIGTPRGMRGVLASLLALVLALLSHMYCLWRLLLGEIRSRPAGERCPGETSLSLAY